MGAGGDAVAGGRGSGSAPMPRRPEELERELRERYRHLQMTVDELAERLRPRELARRSAAGVAGRAKAALHGSQGELRVERLGAVALGTAAVLAAVWFRYRRRG